MALNANTVPSTKQSNYVPVEQGTYPARLVSIVDLGLQNQPAYQGQAKEPARMIALTYELTDEFMMDEDGEQDESKPRWITEMINFNHLKAEKAKSTLRYHALDADETHGGDWVALLGTPCLVTIVHNPNKKTGGVYENVSSITAMRAKDAAKLPELKNDSVSFDLDNPNLEVFKKLPKFIQDKIRANLEYTGSALDKLLGVGGATPPKDKPATKGKPPLKVVDNTAQPDDDEPPY